MYGYIYITTNIINNKIYIGQKKSNVLNPTYYGSGKILKQAIDKEGIENFKVELLYECSSKEELDKKEMETIKEYKNKFGRDCYNIAKGGNGGDVFYYLSDNDKLDFVNKMTQINKERCSQESFKKKISEATRNRYSDMSERLKHQAKLKDVWKDKKLRTKQSEILKNYYSTHKHDCSFNFQKCRLEFNGEKIEFESIKELRNYLKHTLNYTPDNRKFKQLLDSGDEFKAFHKKFNHLNGLRIYKLNDDVETNRDECSGVGVEIGTTSKDEATLLNSKMNI